MSYKRYALRFKSIHCVGEARELTQNYNIEAAKKIHLCRNIKKQLANFVQIELGKYICY